MEHKQDEQSIYLKDLLFAVMHQWRKAVAAAVAFAILLGGYFGICGWWRLSDPEKAEELALQNAVAVERYEAEKYHLQLQVDTLRGNIQRQQVYLAASVLMQLDPYSHYEAVLELHIQTDYQILPDMAYQNPDRTDAILRAYSGILLDSEVFASVTEEMGVERQYLAELLSVEVDPTVGMLSVKVKHPEREPAQKLLGLLAQNLEAAKARVADAVEAHSIRILKQTVEEKIDLELVDAQKAETDRLNQMLKALSDVQTSQQKLERPVTQAATVPDVLKQAGVFALVGAALGVILVVISAWIGYASDGKIYSARMLAARTGIKVLGCMKDAQGRKIADQWLRKWEGRDLTDIQIRQEVLAAHIRNRCKKAKRLLVTGCAKSTRRESLVAALRKAMPDAQIDHYDSPLHCVTALDALSACDLVVLVEKCGQSTYAEVKQQMELVEDCEKPLLGCVLLDG